MAAGSIDKYYLTATGLDGGVRLADRPGQTLQGAFAVANFRFDISALVSWHEGVPTPTVGKPSPEPLVIELQPGSPDGFIRAITEKQVIPHLRLQGITAPSDGALTVYDLRLDNVVVKKVTDTNGVDRLELLYEAVSLTTRDRISADGTLGPAQTIGWDAVDETIFTAPLTAAVPLLSPGHVVGDLEYFLTVDGLDGGVRGRGFEGAFEVSRFSLDIGSLSHWAGDGVSVGGAVAPPLVIDLRDQDLKGFIAHIAAGRPIPLVRLQGVAFVQSQTHTVYDLRLQRVYVSKVTDTDGVDRLELAYRDISLTTTEIKPDRTLGESATIGWHTASGQTFNSPLDPARPHGMEDLSVVPAPFYLTISGLDGEVSTPGHVGAFAVAHYRFDIDALVNGPSGTAGRANPAPLRIGLARDSGLGAGLIPDIAVATGVPRQVRLVGTAIVDRRVEVVYDLRLDGALVSKFTHARGADHLELVYKAISLTTRERLSSGALGRERTVAWDVVAGTTSENPLPMATPGMTLIGDAADDTLVGKLANDRLDGRGGADSMFGGGGDDTYIVDNAGDRVHETTGNGKDTVYANASYALQPGQEVEFLRAHAGATGLTLTGNEFGNELIGGAGDDTLIGGAGIDRLVGHDGIDRLDGGAGADHLHGGGGNDIFAWHFASEGGDTVGDFQSGADRLQFDAAGFGIVNNGFDFVSGSNPQAQGNGPTFLMNTATHSLYFDADGTGASTGPVLITRLNSLAVASDFQFV